MKLVIATLFLLFSTQFFAQSNQSLHFQLQWTESPMIYYISSDAKGIEVYSFNSAIYEEDTPSLPYFSTSFPLPSYGQINTSISNAIWETFDKENSIDDQVLKEYINPLTTVEKDRLEYFGRTQFIPIRKSNNGFERLISFDLNIRFSPQNYPFASSARTDYTNTSVFANADELEMYKIPISSNGIYQLDKNYLEELGINTANIDPKKIKIFGNGGGALPELIDIERLNDLEENPIKVVGEEDGSFDSEDVVIFYAEGPHKWSFDEAEQIFNRHTNIYSNRNYYFLKIDSSNGLRVSDNTAPNLSDETYTTDSFNDYQIFEEDKFNLLDLSQNGYGTGQKWFGDSYKLVREKTYSDLFNFPNITNDSAFLKVNFAARTNSEISSLTTEIAGQNIVIQNLPDVSLSNLNASYAAEKKMTGKFLPNNDILDVTISYPNIGSSEGWLDYISVNARRELKMVNNTLNFRDINSISEATTKYNLSNAENVEIWDITNSIKAKRQEANLNNDILSFGSSSETAQELKEYIAFKTNVNFPIPSLGSKVNPQNLHSVSDVDMLIVYHSNFKAQAEQLAEHRANFSNLDIALADINEIYNEFSSGKLDPGAIREMNKMLFERNPEKFKHVLLLGDGSFDPRNIKNLETVHNYIPVYETLQSFNPIGGFPSDDFFGLISEGEGTSSLSGLLDLSIGRIPVRTAEQAQTVIDKIIQYDTNEEALGDWRNRITFVADNGDGGGHMRDCDETAELTRQQNKNLNIDKIYIDSYQRVATTGDARVPEATNALNNNIFKGQLAVVYLGHGGPGGWTQERILTKEDINNWENTNTLSLFITATCTFAGFDEPSGVSAGEEVLLNEKGGAIALLTTLRPVTTNSNKLLTQSVSSLLFEKTENQNLPLGEAMRVGKNTSSASTTNSRKFLLLGDPAQNLALPSLDIVTTKINQIEVDEVVLDTISALEKVTIEGEVRGNNGQIMNDFNGILYPTIYDKIKNLSTLGQTEDSPITPFVLRKNILFKGRASVTNGKFSFTFIVPKDIDYNYGLGKISYYAENKAQGIDAAGASCDLVIGGIDESAATDTEGPEVEVFMNTWEWVNGGNTNENPILLARFKDDNGINVVGNSIGHDLTGLLDDDSQNSYLLNDFYEAELDDYTSGTVRFPLKNLAEGHHEIKVKAWDIANNSSEGMTEFIVANSARMALTQVLNYPNPFVNKTCFMFNINQSGDLDVLVSIYTISGRLIKTLEQSVFNVQQQINLDNCIEWDGKDDFGDDLAQGVYLYKVRVRNQTTGLTLAKEESEFEKLVIIK